MSSVMDRAMKDSDRRLSCPHRQSAFGDEASAHEDRVRFGGNLLNGLPVREQGANAPKKHPGQNVTLGGQRPNPAALRAREIEKAAEAVQNAPVEQNDLLDDLLGLSPSKPAPAKPAAAEDDDDPFKILAPAPS